MNSIEGLNLNSIELILNSLLKLNEFELKEILKKDEINKSLISIILLQIKLNNQLDHQLNEYTTILNNIKIKIHQLIEKLITINSINLELLSLYSSLFQFNNKTLVELTLNTALELNPKLLIEIKSNGIDSFLSKFNQQQQTTNLIELKLNLSLSLPFIRSTSIISIIFGKSNKVIKSLIQCYDTQLLKLKPIIQSEDLNSPYILWLSIRLEILETLYCLLSNTYLIPLSLHPHPNERIALFDSLESLLLPSLESSIQLLSRSNLLLSASLINVPLLMDLEKYYSIGNMLGQSNGLRRSVLVEKFGKLEESGSRMIAEDGLTVLRRVMKKKEVSTGPATTSNGSSKGKGKAIEVVQSSIPDSESLDLAIAQMLDVFPTYSSTFLRKILLHPSFKGSAEEVISALLEDNLPPDLREDDVIPAEQIILPAEEKIEVVEIKPTLTSGRRNIFEGEKLDQSRIKRGKESTTADSLLADKSFLTDTLKAAIIARAEAESSDEDDEDDDDEKVKHTEAFLEDFDDNRKTFGVRDGNDAEELASEKDEIQRSTATPTPDPLANPITPAISTILELQYLQDPTLFDRSNVTRKSKLRIALREKTGLADEQLEGWRIMLDRNPRKDKILSKHAFSGNKVTVNEGEAGVEGSNSQGGGGGEQSNRGGRGGGRGGGGRGGGGGERGRGKSDGGRAAHDRRQRGNDRKMAKV